MNPSHLLALLSGITKGRWRLQYTAFSSKNHTGDLVAVEGDEFTDVVSVEGGILTEADGKLIEAAPEIAKELLAAMEDNERLREAFRRFITQAMTFRKVNTDEWVEWFENEAIAEAKQALGRPGSAVASSTGSVPSEPLRAVSAADAMNTHKEIDHA